MKKNVVLLSVLAAVLVIAGVGAFAILNNNMLIPAGKETGKVVDFPVLLVTDDGVREMHISELFGKGKVIILEFTFIGCASCEYLHNVGFLQEFYEKYKDKVEIVSIFIHNEDPEMIRAYREQLKVNWKYLAIDQSSGDIILELNIPNLFTHIFLDENGVERLRNPGQIQFVKDNYPKIVDLILRHEYDKLKEFESGPIVEAG